MTYAEIKKDVRSGDVLLVKGTSFFGTAIRMLTGESYSHVAMLVWQSPLPSSKGNLWVFEFVEGKGFQSMPASTWIAQRKGEKLTYGRAPLQVRQFCDLAKLAALEYRTKSVFKRGYGWLSLVKVLLSQITKKRIGVHQRVCSTFVQECWERAGYDMPQTADPGDIGEYCQQKTTLTEEQ